jgi:hypothetical protein
MFVAAEHLSDAGAVHVAFSDQPRRQLIRGPAAENGRFPLLRVRWPTLAKPASPKTVSRRSCAAAVRANVEHRSVAETTTTATGSPGRFTLRKCAKRNAIGSRAGEVGGVGRVLGLLSC